MAEPALACRACVAGVLTGRTQALQNSAITIVNRNHAPIEQAFSATVDVPQ
jgi:hypothetical protein